MGFTRFRWIALAPGLLWPGAARAEIAIEDSIEWLCARADRVLVGRVTSLQPATATAGKSRGLALLAVQPSATLKGPPAPAVCVGVRDEPSAPLERAAAQGTELLFFLSETVQATSYKGLTCNLWPLRDSNAGAWVVPLASPGRRLLSAASAQVLKERGAILTACQQALVRLPPEQRAVAAPESEHALLEVRPGTPVYEVLYGGSACYLGVPRRLFPAARPSLR